MMYGVSKGLALCQQERTDELNNRIADRNIPSMGLQPQFSPRPVLSKYSLLPILDQRMPSNVPIQSFPIYNPEIIFNPGNAQAPWSGFATNINLESSLRNQFFALQKCEQSQYVPSSNSDLYNVQVVSRQIPQTHPLLFTQYNFDQFNPDCLNLAKNVFNNSTRTEIKNIE